MPKPFDGPLYVQTLIDANPWAKDLTVEEADPEFLAQRAAANIALFEKGHEAWNAWALTMESLRRDLELNGLWHVVDKTGYWAPRLGEPDPLEPTNE
jgi:hypothetical protein